MPLRCSCVRLYVGGALTICLGRCPANDVLTYMFRYCINVLPNFAATEILYYQITKENLTFSEVTDVPLINACLQQAYITRIQCNQ